MNSKKVFALFLAIIMLLSIVAGCSQPTANPAPSADSSSADKPAQKDTIKVGVSVSTITEFITDMMASFEKSAAEAKDPAINILGQFTSNRDAQKVFEHINTFKSQGADAVIMNIFDTSIGAEYIEQGGGIPMIFVGRQIDMELCEAPNICYIGGSEYSAGYMQGEYMAKFCKDKGMDEIDYVILIGDLGSQNARERTQGAKDAMQESGIKANLIFEDSCMWARTEAMTKIEQLIGSGKVPDVIIANSDDMALGAYEAVSAAGKADQVYIAGLDGSISGVTAVRDGQLAITVLQNGAAQAAKALECAQIAAQGEPLDAYYEIPFELITPDNLKDYMYILDR